MNQQYGVTINKGPQPWAILQQKNGYASVDLGGNWAPPDDSKAEGQVYVRIVSEDTSEIIVPWVLAEMDSGSRSWRLRLEQVPCGGLYRLETSLRLADNPAMEWNIRGDMIHHLGVGDLWVI